MDGRREIECCGQREWFQYEGITKGVVQERAWVSQVMIDEIPRIKKVQEPQGYKSPM